MKTWMLAIIAKAATWIMHGAAGWVQGETPEYAMRMRRRTKRRVLKEKTEAEATPTPVDDIAPTAADAYMGFATMRAAQRELGHVLALINDYEVRHVLLERQASLLRERVCAAIRILSEGDE